jgi:hypothetical protein
VAQKHMDLKDLDPDPGPQIPVKENCHFRLFIAFTVYKKNNESNLKSPRTDFLMKHIQVSLLISFLW